jgi:hypothetical protein
MRSGWSPGSALNARLTSSRRSSSMPPWKGRCARRRVGVRRARAELLFEVALGVGVLGEDQDAAVVPAGAASGRGSSAGNVPEPVEPSRQSRARVGLVTRPRRSPSSVEQRRSRSSSSPDRARGGGGDLLPPRLAPRSSGRSPRSSSGPGRVEEQGRCEAARRLAARAFSRRARGRGGGRAGCRRRPRSRRAAASGAR